MSLPSTLYTLAAIGFFALMANRPAVELPTPTSTNPTPTEASPTAESANEPSTASTHSASPDSVITPNTPPQASDASSDSQATGTGTNTH